MELLNTFFKRMKNAFKNSTIFGKICLIVIFPIWLLTGLISAWDD